MGLDIHVYHYTADVDAVLRAERAYQERTERLHSYDAPPKRIRDRPMEVEAWRKQQRAKIARELGLNPDGSHPQRARLDAPSEIAPDNINRLGYFRSSYNAGGINAVLQRVLGRDAGYYYIFGREGENEYVFRPDWAASRARAQEVLEALTQAAAQADGLAAMEVTPAHLAAADLDNERDAIRVVQRALERRSPAFGAYSTGNDHFYLDGIKVKALLWGKSTKSIFNGSEQPRLFVVYEDEHGAVSPSYFDSLRVVIETCEYVLAQPRPEQFLLHWSG